MAEPLAPLISDRDRDQTVERLEEDAVAGRLTLAEPARRTDVLRHGVP